MMVAIYWALIPCEAMFQALTWIISLNPHNNLTRWILLRPSFRDANWGSKRLDHTVSTVLLLDAIPLHYLNIKRKKG